MDAIICSAGRSLRMGAAYRHIQKILLEVGERTLLEWHVRNLAAVGIERLHVVTGHLREQVAARLNQLQSRYPVALHEVFNPHYKEGSVLSVQASLPIIEQVQDTILLMDGDVLYDVEVLERLIRSPHPTVLLLDFAYQTADDDPVLVPIRQGRPFEFMKQWQGVADRVGESVGFFKLHAQHIPLLLQDVRERAVGERRLDSYDEVIRALVRSGCFDFEDITGLPWTEIDFPYDLERALASVLPAIRERASRNRDA